jgi:hypothetical protein
MRFIGAAVLVVAAVCAAVAQTTIHVPAGGNLQQAIDQAQPGDTITLAPGATYTGNFRLRKKLGSGFITITTADPGTLPPPGSRITPAWAPPLPKIKTPNASAAIATDNGAHHYRLVGLEVHGSPGVYTLEMIALGSGAATQAADLASDLELDRLYIHGDPAAGGKRGVTLNSIATVIRNCWISDFKSTVQDTQAIAGWNGPGPYTIVNNYLEAAGENLMFGGAVPKLTGVVPSDIIIRGNHFYKPLSWKPGDPSYAGTPWSVKNLLELKNARRVLIEGNVFEHNWVGADQKSFAIVFTVRAEAGAAPWVVVEDVTFVSNVVRHSGSGVNILGRDTNSGGLGITRRVLIANNLFYDLDPALWGGDGRILQILEGAQDITVDHNTFIQQNPKHVIAFGGAPSPRLTYTHNISMHGAYGVQGTGKGAGQATLDYYSPGYAFYKNVLVSGNGSVYPPNNFFPATVAQVGFVDAANDDYRLADTSPYKNAGVDGKDLGADIAAVLAATAQVTNPPAPPGQGQAPAAVSATPSSGQGMVQTFQFAYADGDGYADIEQALVLVNSSLAQAAACQIYYQQSQNALWLRDDQGAGWLGPAAVGAAGSLTNSQCSVDAGASAAVGAGNALSLTLSLRFAASFSGTKKIYMQAVDQGGRGSGWQQRGSWVVPNSPPQAVSVTPASGQGSAQTFQFLFSDANGYNNIATTQMLFHSTLTPSTGCYLQFQPGSGKLWLRNDAGTGWLGPVVAGTTAQLSNTRCSVDAAGSSWTGAGPDLTVRLAMRFTSRFQGARNIYMRATDKSGAGSGWQKRGVWSVP